MTIDRRQFLQQASVLGLATTLAPRLAISAARPLKVLILGGTGFIGPHLVQAVVDAGHEVTLFNRGKTNTHLFPQAKKLVGDRDGGLDALKTGEWDVVMDNSGYVPRHVRDSAQLLKNRVGRYLFTSSVSAYDFTKTDFPFAVGSALAPLAEPDSEDVGKYYGALKVVCEQIVNDIYGKRATIVRPTYVCGPGDRTQRYTWWVDRIHRGGDILAPGDPRANCAIVDVGDLSRFMVHLSENNIAGTFNASGPAGVLSFSGMLASIRATTDAPARFHWIPESFLNDRISDGEMPLWTAGDSYSGLMFENQSSIDAGLQFTTLAQTARSTWEWYQQQPLAARKFSRAGIDADKEQEILNAWTAAGLKS
jgi:2'-hydroxyisoflavone reductase